jgi:hypothetical protein
MSALAATFGRLVLLRVASVRRASFAGGNRSRAGAFMRDSFFSLLPSLRNSLRACSRGTSNHVGLAGLFRQTLQASLPTSQGGAPLRGNNVEEAEETVVSAAVKAVLKIDDLFRHRRAEDIIGKALDTTNIDV